MPSQAVELRILAGLHICQPESATGEAEKVARIRYLFDATDAKPVPGEEFVAFGLHPGRVGVKRPGKRKSLLVILTLDRTQGFAEHWIQRAIRLLLHTLNSLVEYRPALNRARMQ